jgi:hypothetical protein
MYAKRACGEQVKKPLIAIGIVLIFFGVIVASASNTPKDKLPLDQLIAGGYTAWEVHGGPYDNGQELLVYFGNPPETLPDITFDVEIWPDGRYENKSVFLICYPQVLNSRTMQINLTSNEGGLAVSNQTQEIGGAVNYAGDYWANITTRWAGWNPPPMPELRLEVIEQEYPYRYVLPIGAGLIAVGASCSILGATSIDRKSRLKKKER